MRIIYSKLYELKMPREWKCRGHIDKKLNLLKYKPREIIGRRIIAHDYDYSNSPRTSGITSLENTQVSIPKLSSREKVPIPLRISPLESLSGTLEVDTFVPIRNFDNLLEESSNLSDLGGFSPWTSIRKSRPATEIPSFKGRGTTNQGNKGEVSLIKTPDELGMEYSPDMKVIGTTRQGVLYQRRGENSVMTDASHVRAHSSRQQSPIFLCKPKGYVDNPNSQFNSRIQSVTPGKKNRHKILNFAIDGIYIIYIYR